MLWNETLIERFIVASLVSNNGDMSHIHFLWTGTKWSDKEIFSSLSFNFYYILFVFVVTFILLILLFACVGCATTTLFQVVFDLLMDF